MIKQYLNEALSACEKLLANQPIEQSGSQPTETTSTAVVMLGEEAAQAATTQHSLAQPAQEWMEACQTVANILTSMGFVKEAYPWRSMALDLAPEHAKFYAESGRVCSQCEAWEQALYFCQRTLEYEPDNAAVHCQLAKVYHQMGDRAAEIETLNKLLAQRPEKADAEGHYQLGQVLRGQQQTSAAIACYKRAIEQDKQYEAAYYALGDLQAQSGNYAQTVELFEQMVQQLPETASARYRLGRAYRQTQQPEQAIEAFRAAIALDPQLRWPYMGLLTILMQRNLFDEAIATCQSAIERTKQESEDTAWAYCFLGNAQAKKGEATLATRAHQQAFALKKWSQAAERDYHFGQTWFSENIPVWAEHLQPLNELSAIRPPLRMLSLGAQDESSLLWLVDTVLIEPGDQLLCLSDRQSNQFQQNREKLTKADKLVLQTDDILTRLEELAEESLDFAYIQSNCKRADYLRAVSTCIWKSIKPSGLMCFKDYQWQHPSDPNQSSKVGVDAFIAAVSNKAEVLCRSHQVMLRKCR